MGSMGKTQSSKFVGIVNSGTSDSVVFLKGYTPLLTDAPIGNREEIETHYS